LSSSPQNVVQAAKTGVKICNEQSCCCCRERREEVEGGGGGERTTNNYLLTVRNISFLSRGERERTCANSGGGGK
jgi:hypothetical protein